MLTALIVPFVVFQAAVAEDPVLHKDRGLTCADWARTANHYLRLGEGTAIAELLDRSGVKPTKFAIEPNHACHILRLLFEPKKGETLRRPLLGGWGGVPNDKNWPDFPFVVHAETIFLFVDGYQLAGAAETPAMYAKYLRENGTFKRQFYATPTGKKAKQALDLLVRSKKWVAELGSASPLVGRLRQQTNYLP